jgi:hypothetical protein
VYGFDEDPATAALEGGISKEEDTISTSSPKNILLDISYNNLRSYTESLVAGRKDMVAGDVHTLQF